MCCLQFFLTSFYKRRDFFDSLWIIGCLHSNKKDTSKLRKFQILEKFSKSERFQRFEDKRVRILINSGFKVRS